MKIQLQYFVKAIDQRVSEKLLSFCGNLFAKNSKLMVGAQSLSQHLRACLYELYPILFLFTVISNHSGLFSGLH